ncbi:MAG: ribonuclease HII [Candidatus Caenarcaniphilales bacterium]|nr:ribonuclease HII [Candidatus Caenarcaniphilales bacterium]
MYSPLIDFDLHIDGANLIGVDEVGRGSLAGPVVAAASHFVELKSLSSDYDWPLTIKDSKQLSKKKRTELNERLRNKSTWGIGFSSVEEINQIGILSATLLAMDRAINSVKSKTERKEFCLLVDGITRIPDLKYQQKTIVRGDSMSFHIAAASIIAKVERDQYMKQLSIDFPDYDWESNAGYGTIKHRQAILKYGPTEHHRLKFLRKLTAQEVQTKLSINQKQFS